jgi:hypothetical protein
VLEINVEVRIYETVGEIPYCEVSAAQELTYDRSQFGYMKPKPLPISTHAETGGPKNKSDG